MRKLEEFIGDWRNQMVQQSRVGSETVDELESHLRELAEEFIKSGVSDEEAFNRAVSRLGNSEAIGTEFKKLNEQVWLPIKLAACAAAIIFLLVAFRTVSIASREGPGGLNWFLAFHVLTITAGYAAVLFSGGLGICYVLQRCYSPLGPSVERSLERTNVSLAWVAAVATSIGVILGGFWALAAWGRFWAWDPKESGGLGVIIWSIICLVVNQIPEGSLHRRMLLSIGGNIVVILAWFGADLLMDMQRYGGAPGVGILSAVIACHLVVLLIGVTSANRLKLKQNQDLED